MKKLIVIALLGLIVNVSYSQWITRHIDNGIDDPYYIAFSQDKSTKCLLKLEENNGAVALYITGSYYCSDFPIVDLAFKVNGVNKRHHLVAKKSRDSKTIFLVLDITTEDQKDFLDNFLNASSMVVRVNEETCTDEYYLFDMTNSTKAFNTIKNQ